MIITLLLFIIVLIADCFFIKKNTIYSPWSLTLIVWTIELFLYLTIDHGLYNMTGNFEFALILWLLSFIPSSYCVSFIGNPSSHIQVKKSEYNHKIFLYLFIISLICVPFSIYKTYTYASSQGFSDNIFFNLRYTATQDDYDSGILKYVSYIAIICLYAECNSKKIKKIRLTILYILTLLLGLSTMAKTTLFVVIVGSLFILIWNKRVKSRVLLIVPAVFIIITVIFSGLRSYTGEANSDISKTLTVYTLSPMVAFDKDASETISHNYEGWSTLRFFYQIGKSIGFNVEVENTIQKFIEVPYSTNVYTIFYQYYKDFGYLGVFLFGIIDGCLYGFVYSRINRNPTFRLIYAYLAVTLVLQFFNEIFWVTASIVIQICILSTLIYFNDAKIGNRNNLRLV